MPYSPPCLAPSATGLLDIKMAAPGYTGATKNPLVDLGVAEDSLDLQDRPFYHAVHTDRNGGQQGPAEEFQYLGHIVTGTLVLNTFNQAAIDTLRQRSVNAVLGTIAQDEVGSFMLLERGVRILLGAQDPTKTRNFWTCLVQEPIGVSLGTKYSQYRIPFTAYRPPCGHQKANILEDKDDT